MFRKHKYINFDHNATTPPTRHVLAVLRKIYREGYNNPSAAYFGAQKTAGAIERARQQVATALGCDYNEIIFTSGASESNSLIASNFNLKIDKKSHHSLLSGDWDTNHMILDYEYGEMRHYVKDTTYMALPMIVSETGECLIDEVNSNPTKQYFLDLTQAIGKVQINLHSMPNVMFASASGHKFGGILGCGILYINKNFNKKDKIRPLIYGTQENNLRGGTYNVPAIICFGEAIEEATQNINKNQEQINKIIDYIYSYLEDNYKSYYKNNDDGTSFVKVVFNELKFRKHYNTINITFNNLLATTAVQIFNKYGIYISAGSACSSGEEKPSSAYLASGYTYDEAMRTIRISVGINNTIREAKKFVKILQKIIDNYDISC